MSKTPKEALEKIKNAKNNDSTTLDLSGLTLKEIPEEVCDLIDLKELYLHNNQLFEIPESIGAFLVLG